MGVFDPAATLPAEHRTLAWYLTALGRRDTFIIAWEAFFERYHAVILPAATSTAFPHDTADTDGNGRMLALANLAGVPALTVPAGRDRAGLPIGVQIVGPRWSEMRLLDIARALEQASVLPGFTAPPGY